MLCLWLYSIVYEIVHGFGRIEIVKEIVRVFVCFEIVEDIVQD